MFFLHCRSKGGTMFTVGFRSGYKAWRALQVNSRECWAAQLQGPSGLIIARYDRF